MQSLYNMVFGSQPQTSEDELEPSQEESKGDDSNHDNGDVIDKIADSMPEDMVNRMQMFTLNDCTLYDMKKNAAAKKAHQR